MCGEWTDMLAGMSDLFREDSWVKPGDVALLVFQWQNVAALIVSKIFKNIQGSSVIFIQHVHCDFHFVSFNMSTCDFHFV